MIEVASKSSEKDVLAVHQDRMIGNVCTSMQQAIKQCITRGESLIYIDSKDHMHGCMDIDEYARNNGYAVLRIEQQYHSGDVSFQGSEYDLGKDGFRKPAREKCLYHIVTHWNFTMFDDFLDLNIPEFIKTEIEELIREADDHRDGLKVPVTIIVDNMLLLCFAYEGERLEWLLGAMQRREEWKIKIIAGL